MRCPICLKFFNLFALATAAAGSQPYTATWHRKFPCLRRHFAGLSTVDDYKSSFVKLNA
jgi:hypothetical protein